MANNIKFNDIYYHAIAMKMDILNKKNNHVGVTMTSLQ